MPLSAEQKDVIRNEVTAAIKGVLGDGNQPFKIPNASVQEPSRDEVKRFKMGSMIHATTMAKHMGLPVEQYVKEKFNAYQKSIFYAKSPSSMNSGEFTYGGSFIQGNMGEEIIPALTAAAVVRGSNPQMVPMPSGSYTQRKLTQGSNAQYVGETGLASTSRPTTGILQLTAKKLVTVVPFSNSLIRRADTMTFEMLGNQMMRDASAREDLAFIRGDGTANTPKGFRNLAASANVLNMTGSVSATTVQTDISRMITAIYGQNVSPIRPTWFMPLRVREYLANLKDNGQKVYPSIEESNTLKGHPIKVSNQIPTTLGSGTNEAEVYLVDMGYTLIGDTYEFTLDTLDGATYYDGSGTVYAAQQDESIVRLIGEHDIGMQYDEAIAVLTGVTWGA
jgi:HK97 family phage major capsid protein